MRQSSGLQKLTGIGAGLAVSYEKVMVGIGRRGDYESDRVTGETKTVAAKRRKHFCQYLPNG